MLILLATEKPFAPDAVASMEQLADESGHTLEALENYKSKQELLSAVAEAEALIVRSDIVDADVVAAGKKLKIIVRAGAGVDNVDLAAATARNICVMNTPGQNSNAVAEMVFGGMIYQSRNQFDGSSGRELGGKRIGIIGFGHIGRRVAELAKGFDMHVYVAEPKPHADTFARLGIEVVSIEDIFKLCDYVSLHLPSTEATKGIVGRDLLMSMPRGAMLVNAARQDLVEEGDLAAVMRERTDISYVSDFAPKHAELLNGSLASRVFYPKKKMGAQTEEANVNAGMAAVRQIISFFENGDETFRVNPLPVDR
jgi:D-3-phosphoglycerate dehydrogenase